MTACQEQPGPSLDLPREKNPKLGSQLDQLVRAEGRGEAASFARKNNIVLVDERVRVIVESLPGQIEAVAQAAGALGVVEATSGNLLQVLVPVGRLTALSQAEGVRLVRLPQEPLPGAATGAMAED